MPKRTVCFLFSKMGQPMSAFRQRSLATLPKSEQADISLAFAKYTTILPGESGVNDSFLSPQIRKQECSIDALTNNSVSDCRIFPFRSLSLACRPVCSLQLVSSFCVSNKSFNEHLQECSVQDYIGQSPLPLHISSVHPRAVSDSHTRLNERSGTAVTARTYLQAVLERRSIEEVVRETSNSFSHGPPPSTKTVAKSAYMLFLEQRGLISPSVELDWSGKGQHVEFDDDDEVPLQNPQEIASSTNAWVTKVQCKNILVARKMMRFTRRWKLQDAIVEIEHLTRLRHAHIIQLVGSYLLGKRNFAILLYPVADYHLGTFLEDTADQDVAVKQLLEETHSPQDLDHMMPQQIRLEERKEALRGSLACLAHALDYIHGKTTKHMDIKPANILVRYDPQLRQVRGPNAGPGWRFYIADFGLSRHFSDEDQSQTAGATARTPRWCAPEVYDYASRGRSADIFSLGCVFMEILTVIIGFHIEEFSEFRRNSTHDDVDDAFRLHVQRLPAWLEVLRIQDCHTFSSRREHTGDELLQRERFDCLMKLVKHMVQLDPQLRPTAAVVTSFFQGSSAFDGASIAPDDYKARGCCDMPPEPFTLGSTPGTSGTSTFNTTWATRIHNVDQSMKRILAKVTRRQTLVIQT
jgi:serine/threonine protein kinase